MRGNEDQHRNITICMSHKRLAEVVRVMRLNHSPILKVPLRGALDACKS